MYMRDKEQVFKELQQLSTFKMFGTKKEVSYLPEILHPNEHVLGLISGFLDGNTWIIALTQKRLIFLDKGMFYGLKQREILLDKINSIFQKQGLVLGSITIQDGASAIKIDNIDKSCIPSFVDSINSAIDRLKSPKANRHSSSNRDSAIDDLRKYKQLYEEGIITKEDFIAKKKQLLGI